MDTAAIILLIFNIAVQYDLPPEYVQAIALTENASLDPHAINVNYDGSGKISSRDLGLMQLNDSWYSGPWQDPEENIRAACILLAGLKSRGLDLYQMAVAYNCGYSRYLKGPPEQSIRYANKVFVLYSSICSVNQRSIQCLD